MPDLKELRVHGVSGTPPRDMLYTDPVARDVDPSVPRTYTTVYRKPDRGSGYAVEAFHWGGLTAGSWRTAFWILLAPFAFANIAGWMAERQSRTGRAAVRVAGVALTALFVSQAAVALVDLPHHWLSARIGGLGLRLSMIGLHALLGFAFFLLVQKASAQSHFPPGLSSDRQLELVLDTRPETMLPDGEVRTDADWDDPAGATLGEAVVWERHAILHRLRRIHLAAGVLVVAMTAARGVGNTVLEWVVVAGFALTIGLTVLTTFTPRSRLVRIVTAWAPGISIGIAGLCVALLLVFDLPASGHWTGVHETTFQIALVMFAAGALTLVTGLAPLGSFAIGAQLGGAFGIAAAVVMEYFVGVDEIKDNGAGWTSVAMLFLFVILLMLVGRLARPWKGSGLDLGADDPDHGRRRRLMTILRRVTVDARAVFKLAGLFGIAAGGIAVYLGCFSGSACHPFNLGRPPRPALTIALAVIAILLLWWTAHRVFGPIAVLLPVGAGALIAAGAAGFLKFSILKVQIDLTSLVGVSIAFTVLLPASFILNSLVRGFRDAERRRKVGILWDVASFFPRWYHPLAPPAYGPFVVQQLKQELTERPRDLLAAHSQGAMISLVTLGQMDAEVGLCFLSYGCQLGLHYPRLFPTAGIEALVDEVGSLVGPGSWISLWRANDPLGGEVGQPVVDRMVDDGIGHSTYELTQDYRDARSDLIG
ncbi:MAG: hypothetical protein WBZ40_07935 [Acidimicrobiia bacterium]